MFLLIFARALTAGAGQTAVFDGKTFAGWEGDLGIFRIQDGAIVGGSLARRVARNEFLWPMR